MHLKVINTKEINGVSFYIVKYGDGTAMVKMYPFQRRTQIPDRIPCLKTKTVDGKERIVQDKQQLL